MISRVQRTFKLKGEKGTGTIRIQVVYNMGRVFKEEKCSQNR